LAGSLANAGNKKGEKFKNFSPFLLFAFEVYLTGFNQHN